MKKSDKISANNKRIWIAICAVLFVIGIIVGLVFALNRGKENDKSLNNNGEKNSQTESVGAMKDGEIIDYEKDGSLTLDAYKGIKGTVTPTKEDIYLSILNDVEEKNIKIAGEERVKKGDWILLDYSGEIDGQASEDLEEEGIVIQVGAGDLFNADFERKLTGLSLGQEYSFDVAFPSDYFDIDVAGQTVTFTVTISRKFNEAFVKPLSNNKYQTVDEYYAQVKKKVRQENVDALGDTVWDDYIAKCKVKKYPQGSKKQAFADLKRQYNGFGKANGTSYEEVIAGFGMTEEDVKELAKDEVKGRMVAKTIVAKEGLVLSDEQYRKYLLEEVAVEDGEDQTLMALEKKYKEETSAYPRDDMLIRLVKEFIGEHAKQE